MSYLEEMKRIDEEAAKEEEKNMEIKDSIATIIKDMYNDAVENDYTVGYFEHAVEDELQRYHINDVYDKERLAFWLIEICKKLYSKLGINDDASDFFDEDIKVNIYGAITDEDQIKTEDMLSNYKTKVKELKESEHRPLFSVEITGTTRLEELDLVEVTMQFAYAEKACTIVDTGDTVESIGNINAGINVFLIC